ncbi:unnamed protein product [Adineta ricciae]|uniref:Uncharacterized protein n=1 Tax=Adineta ricciae TaxID=249248 RepID=A0A816EJW1_ADIRI|nr:unnamed protein product [Adineta ricciae]CAF1650226.1 unnamed protein product [Adineta ricciae]
MFPRKQQTSSQRKEMSIHLKTNEKTPPIAIVELQRITRQKRCSSRWIIGSTIFILVAITCIVASLVALFITIDQSKTTTTTTSTTTTTTTTTTTSTSTTSITTTSTTSTTTFPICSPSLTPITWFEPSTTIPPQCSTYLTISDSTRLPSYYSGYYPSCDNSWPFSSTSFIWIRFQNGSDHNLMDYPVSTGYCDATYPGWYAGLYPSTFYTTATSIVCFNDGSNNCRWCTPVKVTSCGNYYVFALLSAPICAARYCII